MFVIRSRFMENNLRFVHTSAVVLGASIALAGCVALPLGGGAPSSSTTALDAVAIEDLLPTTSEVEQRLGWTDDVNYTAPDFDAFLQFSSPQELIEPFGGALAIGVDCADALTASSAIPGAPIGATDVSSSMWAEGGVTVRELWLSRYPSVEEASAQVADLVAYIEACPTVNLASGNREIQLIATELEDAVAFRAIDGSYSWVVASFSNLVAQVTVGTSDAELASAEALINLQRDKLTLISRGDYE